MFKRLGHFLKISSRRKAWFLGLTALFLVSPVLATTGGGGSTAYEGDFINNIMDIINVINLLVALLTAPAAIMAGWLLTPDWTFGDFFGIREYLYEIWVLVSNIVYIIFAMILLWLAAMGIFGSPNSEYVIKKKLPMFLVGILMVPFTWFIVSFTLTMVNKGIAVVMSIPRGTIIQLANDDDSSFHDRVIPTYIELQFENIDDGSAHGGFENLVCNQYGYQGSGSESSGGYPCISPAEFIANNRSGPFFMIMVYAYDIFKIQRNDLVNSKDFCTSSTDESCIRSLTALLAKFTFNVLFSLVFSILLIALSVALLYRAFMLWIYIIFSPAFGLAVFFGKSSQNYFDNKLGFFQFFKLAVVPLLVAAVLSFGLLFIGVMRDNPGGGGATFGQTQNGTQCTSGTWAVQFCVSQGTTTDSTDGTSSTDYTSRVIIGGTAQDTRDGSSGIDVSGSGRQSGQSGASDYSITFEFGSAFSDIFNDAIGQKALTEARGAVGGLQDLFSYTIMNLIALVIIWMGFMSAFKIDDVLKSAVEPFQKMGTEVGRIVKSLPGLIKIPGTEARIGSFGQTLSTLGSQMQNLPRQEGAQMGSNLFKNITGTDPNKFSNAVDEFKRTVDSRSGAQHGRALRELVGTEDFDMDNSGHRRQLIDSINDVIEKEGGADRRLTPDQVNELVGIRDPESLGDRLDDILEGRGLDQRQIQEPLIEAVKSIGSSTGSAATAERQLGALERIDDTLNEMNRENGIVGTDGKLRRALTIRGADGEHTFDPGTNMSEVDQYIRNQNGYVEATDNDGHRLVEGLRGSQNARAGNHDYTAPGGGTHTVEIDGQGRLQNDDTGDVKRQLRDDLDGASRADQDTMVRSIIGTGASDAEIAKFFNDNGLGDRAGT